jgi:tRNA threonylcarbamoyl adenosine modification protein YjeE
VKGLAKGLGLDARVVSSPTFVLAQQYALPAGPETLHHVDLYRLEAETELETVGFYDMLAPGQVLAVEWADRFPDVLGREFLSIEFEGPSPEEDDAAREGTPWRGRRARVTAHGENARRVLADWAFRVDGTQSALHGRVVSSPEMRLASILVLLLGLLLLGRLDRAPDDARCDLPIALDSDALGTLHVACSSAYSGPRDADRTATGQAVGEGLTGLARWLDGRAVDLNRASASLLESLPEIGPVRAAAIERSRLERPFASVADLERVSGIGPKTRARIERWLFVSDEESGSVFLRGRGDRDG